MEFYLLQGMTMNDEPSKPDGSAGGHPDPRLTTTFDPDVDSVSEELITAIASSNDADPTELEILAHSIDPDALDALVSSHSEVQGRDGHLQVRFRYAGHVVSVDSDGTISVDPGGDRN